MGLFNKLFGKRWSLYIVRNENELLYAMHENSVHRMVGYVINSFVEFGEPVEPWSLILNFNKNNSTIKLNRSHFTDEGHASDKLINEIESIDSGWKVKGAEPVFFEAATKKVLKISNSIPSTIIDFQKEIDNVGKPKEVTFFSVMDDVFGK